VNAALIQVKDAFRRCAFNRSDMPAELKLLVIEDDPADFLLLQRVLAQQGLGAMTRRVDSALALREALQGDWDAVLSDYSVPGMDFPTTLRLLREHDPLLPVILVSGSIGEEHAVELMRAGLDDFILKDRMARLPAAVRQVCAQASARRDLAAARLETAQAERDFRTLFEKSPAGMLVVDAGTLRILDASARALRMFGYDLDAMRLLTIGELTHPDDRAATAATSAALSAGETSEMQVEKRYLRKGGGYFWAEVAASTLRDGAGHIVRGLAIILDISERKQAQAELRIAATAFDSQEGMIIAGADGVIQRVNKAFTRITGYSAEEAVGRTPRFLQSGGQDRAFYAEMWRRLLADGFWQGELRNRHRNGDLYSERLAISAVRDEHGQVLHYVGTISDISGEERAKARAEHLTYFDPLTELPNRGVLEERIAAALVASAASGEQGALLLLDLDEFKKINDSLGHQAGDWLLVEAAHRLRLVVREGDTLARFSGDTFAVLIEELGPEPQQAAQRAGVIAEKVRQALAHPCTVAQHSVVCTASVGVTVFGGASAAPGTLLQEAELAMYRAKAQGRNAVRLFEPRMQSEFDARNVLEADLRGALRDGQFVVHYQIQVDVAGRALGAEALLRWNHPRRGMVYPDAFIAAAESSGRIEDMGRWVLEQCCAQLVRWAAQPATRELCLAVNVSARQFKAADFVAVVLSTLHASGAAPRRLKLEITESLALDDMDDCVVKLAAIKAHGVRISLDDFGTGNSSLAYLTRLPLDQLKIDKSFVGQLPQSRSDALVAQAIIAMGKGLEMEVIAEGVETEAQARFLRDHGCDAFQGYFYGRPLPLEAFELALPATLGAP
jgi:diguanylate cyclase (GGDEF)-like protein/PAS domain S-box-containing protein